MNSLCCVIVVFMAIVKHFRVKMRLVSLVLPSPVNLIFTLKITSKTYLLRRISV